MISIISTDVLAIIALCFTIGLAKRNAAVNNKKNSIYILASVATIILLILEIATILMELSSNNKLLIPYRIANVLGFSLSPLVPYILLFFNSNRGRKYILRNYLLRLPLYINFFICIISYKTGFIFFVDAQNQYTRGELFLLPTIIGMLYYVLFVIAAIKNGAKYELEDKKVLIPILFIPVLGTILQILFEDLILIWSCSSISLLLYYIFLLEVQFKYDVLAKIKNRAAFEKKMEQYDKSDKNAAIVMLDLNNLKRTNDKHGHKAGDDLIFNAAKAIEESFMGIGTAYRIGGDEFCVICTEMPKESVDSALSKLDSLLIEVNQNRHIKIILAYGYAFYNKDESESIYSAFAKADKAMYIHKAKLKGVYGRRQGD
ncbi:MAG: GGDEF domain-containing protein [Clostridiaceae bacterium]